jgi:hypothetical protein
MSLANPRRRAMLFVVIERFKQEWILSCQGLGTTFEIVQVLPSKESREVVAPYLDPK